MGNDVAAGSPLLRRNERTGKAVRLRQPAAGIVLLVAALLFPAVRTAAQNTWKYHNNPDMWSNATEWSMGVVPDGSTDISIGLGTVNGDTSFTNSNILLIGSAATLNLLSGTTITNAPAGIIQNFGTLQGPGAIDNSGLLYNAGNLNTVVSNTGSGTVTNDGSGTLLLANGSLIQGGTLNNVSGTLGPAANSSVTLDGSTAAGAVTIQGMYSNEGGTTTTTNLLGTIDNQGQIYPFGSQLQLIGNTTLQGGGTLTLGGSSISSTTPVTLKNVDNTINGYGPISGPLTIINSGTINANTEGFVGALTFAAGTTLTNTGVLKATGGGVLDAAAVTSTGGSIIADGTNPTNSSDPLRGTIVQFANQTIMGGSVLATSSAQVHLGTGTVTGAMITASNGGSVLFYGSDIQGGTLNNVSGTLLAPAANSSVTLDGSTAAGAVTIQGTYGNAPGANTSTLVLGTISNQGTMYLPGAQLQVVGNTTLQGGGTVTLASTAITVNTPVTLTNVDNTIQGYTYGAISGPLTLINGGTINANTLSQEIGFDSGTTLSNTGVLEATGGGTLNATAVTSTGGSIIADGLDNSGRFINPGTTVQFASQSITGGSVLATNSAQVHLGTGTVTGATITASNSGSVLFYGSDIQGGTLNNVSGTIGPALGYSVTLDGSTAAGAVTIQGTYTNGSTNLTVVQGALMNNGVLQNQSGGQIEDFGILNNNSSIQNASGSRITVFNTLNNNQTLQNSGELQVGVGLNAGTLDNSGTILNTNGGLISVLGGATFNNSGDLESDAQSYFTTAANSAIVNTGTMSFTVNPVSIAGTLRNDGVINMNGQAVPTPVAAPPLTVTSTGTLSGTGFVNGNVVMQGTMAPGDTTGLFTINGNFTESGTSATFLENIMGAGQNGQLVVNGDVFLLGTLDVDLLNGFIPQSDESWVLMQYTGALSGVFATDIFPEDGFDWSVVYDAADHEVLLDVTGVGTGGSGGTGGGGTNPTPEPGTLLLMAVGAGILVLLQKTRRAEEVA